MGLKLNICCSVFVIFTAMIFGWIINLKRNTELYTHSNTLNNWINYGTPSCHKPIVLKNAFNITKYNDCNNKNHSYCWNIIADRLNEHFGDRMIEARPPIDVNKTKTNVSIWTKLSNFLFTSEYNNYYGYSIKGFNKLGSNPQEYDNFLNFENINGSNINYSNLISRPNSHHYGTQFFIAREIYSGSDLHWNIAQSIFIMLAGRKRWIKIHPKHAHRFDCVFQNGGYYGRCLKYRSRIKEYNPNHINMTNILNVIKNKLYIADDAYMDSILEPGDIVFNCGAWPHIVQNLDNDTVGLSLRCGPSKKLFFATTFSMYHIPIFAKSFMNAIEEKWNNPNSITVFDGIYKAFMNEKTNFGDADYANQLQYATHRTHGYDTVVSADK